MSNKAEKQNSAKQVTAYARNLRVSPRKLRLLTSMVQGMYVDQAVTSLQFAPQKGAEFLLRAIKSAAANAVNNFSLKPEDLYVKSATCDMGKVMKRYFPRARGSAFVIKRKLSHVNVVLGEKKRSGKSASRLELFKKKQKQEASVDKKEATEIKPEKTRARQHGQKSDEQIKMNKVQNKRRMFNRKSGE
ncbi:MAG: 50S ribosomal protein L22 [Candidatus Doudnabacteria bacterium]|nr:50S ribosomal protein L22 [Candidatus Doudnabacteria bacterium]